MTTICDPAGNIRERHPDTVTEILDGRRNWHICYVCGGADPECEYCDGFGWNDYSVQESKYDRIAKALSHPRKTYLYARLRYFRRLLSRPIRNLADWISDDDNDCC